MSGKTIDREFEVPNTSSPVFKLADGVDVDFISTLKGQGHFYQKTIWSEQGGPIAVHRDVHG